MPDETENTEVLNAVIVVRRETENGVETDVIANGDVKVTEIQTILELGLSKWRKQLGF